MKENIPEKPGVYCMNFSGKLYFGSTTNLKRRKQQHFANMRRGKASEKMQLQYNKTGQPSFSVVSVHSDVNDARKHEQFVIDSYSPSVLVNDLQKVQANVSAGRSVPVVFNGKQYKSKRAAWMDSGQYCSLSTFCKYYEQGLDTWDKIRRNKSAQYNKKKYPFSILKVYFNGRFWESHEEAMRNSVFEKLYESNTLLTHFGRVIKEGALSDYHLYLRRMKAYKNKCYKTLAEAARLNQVTIKDVRDWRSSNKEAAAKTERLYARIRTTNRYYPRGKKFVI